MKKTILVLSIALLSVTAVFAQDPGWPRQQTSPAGKLIYYQPQVDDWKNFQQLDWRMAFSLTPTGGKEVLGAASLQGTTAVDTDNHMVAISNIKITNTYFPSLDPATSAKMSQTLGTFLPPTVWISLDRVVACLPKPDSTPTVQLKNDPPVIFVSYSPAILLGVEGQPIFAPIPHTKIEYVVNTSWHLFRDKSSSQFFLLIGQQWQTAPDLQGPWSPVSELPKDMDKLVKEPAWADLKTAIPPPAPQPDDPVPTVFYSTSPADVILFEGQPVYSTIPGTQLLYATNSNSYLFLYSPTNQYYYLAAGRWFSAASLQGPWTYATENLPADFAKIPADSPPAVVLASVPGTEDAKDAVLLAQVPTTVVVNATAAAAQAKVSYDGAPSFAPIQGTSMSYATNTSQRVIQVGDQYFLCFGGIWFNSSSPQGPWQTAQSVPQQIYAIPPSSPVYNVTYVTQTTTSGGNVQSSYTAGYLGAFVMGAAVGAIVAGGTGYYYPPYIGGGFYGGYRTYYPYASTYGATPYYNTRTGAYGASQTAYGPYGSATRGASYNPYTGTYARGASVSTPYGHAAGGAAYNPYTGASAATRQGSNAYGSWGRSAVSTPYGSATAQHQTTARGTVGSMQTSGGGRAVGASSAYGNTAAGRTASGDMYAGHDGNVYKNTGSGWQHYNNGNWNNVNKPNSAEAQQREQSFKQQRSSSSGGWGGGDQMKSMNNDWQNRQRGEQSSQRFSGGGGGGSGWGGGSSRWGGGGGGGGGNSRWGGGGGGSRWGGGGGGGGGRGSWGGGGRRW